MAEESEGSSFCFLCRRSGSCESVELVREQFRVTMTLERTLEKLWDSLFLPTYGMKEVYTSLGKEDGNLFCSTCLPVLNGGLRLQAGILRLEQQMMTLGKRLGDAVMNVERSRHILRDDGEDNDDDVMWKLFRSRVIQNYDTGVLPVKHSICRKAPKPEIPADACRNPKQMIVQEKEETKKAIEPEHALQQISDYDTAILHDNDSICRKVPIRPAESLDASTRPKQSIVQEKEETRKAIEPEHDDTAILPEKDSVCRKVPVKTAVGDDASKSSKQLIVQEKEVTRKEIEPDRALHQISDCDTSILLETDSICGKALIKPVKSPDASRNSKQQMVQEKDERRKSIEPERSFQQIFGYDTEDLPEKDSICGKAPIKLVKSPDASRSPKQLISQEKETRTAIEPDRALHQIYDCDSAITPEKDSICKKIAINPAESPDEVSKQFIRGAKDETRKAIKPKRALQQIPSQNPYSLRSRKCVVTPPATITNVNPPFEVERPLSQKLKKLQQTLNLPEARVLLKRLDYPTCVPEVAGVARCPSCSFVIDLRSCDMLSSFSAGTLRMKSYHKLFIHFHQTHWHSIEKNFKRTEKQNAIAIYCFECSHDASSALRIALHYFFVHVMKNKIKFPTQVSCPESSCSYVLNIIMSPKNMNVNINRIEKFLTESLTRHVITKHDQWDEAEEPQNIRWKSLYVETQDRGNGYKCTRCDFITAGPLIATSKLEMLEVRHRFFSHFRQHLEPMCGIM